VLNLSPDQRRVMQRGEAIYREVCAACHGADGRGAPMMGAAEGLKLAPPLGGVPRVTGHRDHVIKVLLHGLTGPIDDQEYPGGVMVPMGTNTDEWIADVSSYVRNSFGNTALFITPDQVAAVRRASARKTMWTLPELDASLPKPLANQTEWKLSASHNPEAAANALGTTPGARWDTAGTAQQPGMWFQIELPAPLRVTELQIDSAAAPFGRGGRGGRGAPPAGRGAPGAPPAPPPGAPQATAAPTGTAPQAPAGTPAGVAPTAPPATPQAPPAAGRGGGRGGPPATGPVGYTVQVSMDGSTWGPPVAEGTGTVPTTVIAFAPVEARFIRVTQTGRAVATEQWAIGRLRVYEAGASSSSR
jgi:mono/diheme cytochrome c family protein